MSVTQTMSTMTVNDTWELPSTLKPSQVPGACIGVAQNSVVQQFTLTIGLLSDQALVLRPLLDIQLEFVAFCSESTAKFASNLGDE